ncbi:zinc metalloproteinase nas-15-like [Glandiceps talaboti]
MVSATANISTVILTFITASVCLFVVPIETLPMEGNKANGANDEGEFAHLPEILRKRSTPRAINARDNFGDDEHDAMEYILQENTNIVNSDKRGGTMLLEGDIYIGLRGVQHNAIRDVDKLWSGGIIPYTFHSYYDNHPDAKNSIIAVMEHYEELTCIDFVSRTKEIDYLEIAPLQGCWSSVGRDGGRQEISLGESCTEHLGTIMHEFMHALGFYHEQSRTDRDNYIDIMRENIFPMMEYNFEKYGHDKIDDLGAPYDYASIMHYPRKAFSSNGKDTIVPKQVDAKIGQRNFFSKTDLYKINKLYKCDDLQTPTPLPEITTIEPTTEEIVTDSKRWRDDLRCGPYYRLRDGSPSECDPDGPYPCCSPAAWCGVTSDHCSCADCTDYRDNTPSVKWRDDYHCGGEYPLSDGSPSECNPDGIYPCCSPYTWCGNTQAHCSCSGCIDYSSSNPGPYVVDCLDDNTYCEYWSNIGECWKNPAYMHVNCKKSCGQC